MQAKRISQHDAQRELAVTSRGLTLVQGNGAARKRTTWRDGRIRLVGSPEQEEVRQRALESVERAHARLRLPSLETWLRRRLW